LQTTKLTHTSTQWLTKLSLQDTVTVLHIKAILLTHF